MAESKNTKIERVLDIYSKLEEGRRVNRREEAARYGVDERSIQRDIDDIRNYFEIKSERDGLVNSVVYDRKRKGYYLEQSGNRLLSNSEILAVCKILLDSRALTKEEMESLLERLISCCTPQKSRKLVKDLVSNEAFHYIEPRHKTRFLDTMWEIGQAIRTCRYIEIEYRRNRGGALVKRKLKPVAIMFSEFYFYMTAFIDEEDGARKNFEVMEDAFPTIYRIDRIRELTVLNEHFHIPYRDRFEEGEFRKRVQFMYGGKLRKIKFKYFGENVESVLDRLPTAKILEEVDGVYTISAEVFGKGIDMWLRSQGEMVEVVD